MPTIGKDLIAQIQYGPNNCPPKFKVDLQSTDQTDGFVVPQGFTFLSALTLAVGDKNQIMTWQGSELTGTLTSKLIMSNKSYYMFLYDNSMNLLSEQELAAPSGQTLTFPSPFENGFSYNYSTEGNDLTIEFDTPTT
jgi:hypothetical protein